MLSHIQAATRSIRRYRAEFIILNVAFFGLFGVTMTTTVLVPGIQPAMLDAISGIVRTELAAQVHLTGNVLYAASATMAFNLGIALLLISIPSFFVPFSGVVFAVVFAATYGVTLAPIGPYAATMIPHSVAVYEDFEIIYLVRYFI